MKKQILAIFSVAIAVIATFAVVSSTVNAVRPGVVYTINNAAANMVISYARGSDGTLTWAGNFSTQGNGTGSGLGSQGAVVLTDDGNWLLVVNAASNDITVFRVNNTRLTFASKTNSQGMMPVSLTIYGNWVYVLNRGGQGNIAGFQLSNTGNLTYIEGSRQPLSGATNPVPEQIGFNPDGAFLVVPERDSDMINVYMVDENGRANAPMTMDSIAPGPYAFEFTPEGYMIISEVGNNTMSSYALTDDGMLRVLSGAMPTFGRAPCWTVVTDSGRYAYTTNAASGTISTFEISATGTIQLISTVAAKTDTPALDMAFSQNSRYLYVLNGGSITGFQAYSDGSLWQVTTTGGLPASTTGLAAK